MTFYPALNKTVRLFKMSRGSEFDFVTINCFIVKKPDNPSRKGYSELQRLALRDCGQRCGIVLLNRYKLSLLIPLQLPVSPRSAQNALHIGFQFRFEGHPHMDTSSLIIPAERIEQRIVFLCKTRVMLSSDLADLYGVPVKVLNQAVKRNRERFPSDFMFQLTSEEFEILKSQIVTSSWGGARRALPYAFSEHGILTLSSVLRSPRAIQVNIEIMRAFIRLRQMLASDFEFAHKLDELEKKYDRQFKMVFDAIRQLMTPPKSKPRQIGFRPKALMK